MHSYTVTQTDLAGNDSGGATLNVTVDSVKPRIGTGGVAISSATGIQNSRLNAGDDVYVTVTFDQIVDVNTTGTQPQVGLTIGSTAVQADYSSGSGSANLVFKYTILANQTDTDGIAINSNGLSLNGGTIKDRAGNDAFITHAAVADNNGYLVDTTAPSFTAVTISGVDGSNSPKSGNLVAGDKIKVVITGSEALLVSGTPTLSINLGGVTKSATYSSGTGTTALTYYYTIGIGESAASGTVTTADQPISGVTDRAGNAPSGTAPVAGANTVTVVNDTTAPTVNSVSITSANNALGTWLNGSDEVFVTVNFSEPVVVDTTGGTPQIGLTVGSAIRQASYVSGMGSSTSLVFKYTIGASDNAPSGIAIAQNALQFNGGTIKDPAGNPATLAHAQVAADTSYQVDTTAPTFSSLVISGADSSGAAKSGTLGVGDKIKVVLTGSEALLVSGTPSLSIDVGGTSQSATYDTGNGTTALTFYYTIVSNDADSAGGITSALQSIVGVTDRAGNAPTGVTPVPAVAANANAVAVDARNAPSVTISGLGLYTNASLTTSVDTAPAGTLAGDPLYRDFITKTPVPTIGGTISTSLAADEVVEISLNNGSTWNNATTVGTSYSYSPASALTGSSSIQVRVKNTSSGKVGTALSQTYTVDTSITNTFDLGNSVTARPILAGSTDPGASVTVELDNNNDPSTYEVTYTTTANAVGYWSVNTASTTPSSGSLTWANGGTANARVTATDIAGNTLSKTSAGATIATSTYTISNANVIEGNTGTKTLAFLVTRAGDLSGTGSVTYTVNANSSAKNTGIQNGDFSAGSLYAWTAAAGAGVAPTWSSGAALFNNTTAVQGGSLAQTVTTVVGQSYTVTWDQSSTATISVQATGGTLQNFSTAGTNSYTFTATATSTTLTFADATTATGTNVTIDNIKIPGTNNTNSDYAGTNTQILNFAAGETSKLITYTVNGDYYREVNDKLQIDLSNPNGGLLVKSYGTGTIQEMDPTRMQAAYSLNDVNPNLATPAIRVRRASDNTEQDIGFDSYGQIDVAAMTTFAGSGADKKLFVTKWYDQSGNGRDMAQSNAAQQGVIMKSDGTVIRRSDNSVGISFNNGENGGYTTTLGQVDIMTAPGVAASNWASTMIVMKAQSTGAQDGTAFNLLAPNASPNRVLAHYGWGGIFYWDAGDMGGAGRLSGGTVTQNVANDIVFESHAGNTTAGTASQNYVDATQAIFMDGVRVVSDNTVASTISTSSTWALGSSGGTSSEAPQNMTISEFMVYLATDNSTPTIQTLRGSSEADVMTYAGESINGIDGGAGYDVVYLSGAVNLAPATLTNGLKNVEQIWAANGSANTITLTDAVLTTNASSLVINMDAGDSVVLNGTGYAYSAYLQTVVLGTATGTTTGNDTLSATFANDWMIGRGGSDTFKWLATQTGNDTVADFSINATNGKDALDISALLQGYANGAGLSNWVTLADDGTDTTLTVDLDGAGSNTATQTIVVKGVAPGYSLDDWVNNNLLKVL